MLKVINLFVIEKIFENSNESLLGSEKILYINCLIFHFKTKLPKESEAVQFSIFLTQLHYSKFQRRFERLHKAGLVDIQSDRIVFHNLWGQYIDRTLLDKETSDYEGPMNFHNPDKFKGEILSNQSLRDFVCKTHKIDVKKFENLVSFFITEQTAVNKRYSNYSEFANHFKNWVKYNTESVQTSSIKSTGKRMGD